MAIICILDNCLCSSLAIYHCLLLLGDYLPRFDDPSRLSGQIQSIFETVHIKRHTSLCHMDQSITNRKNIVFYIFSRSAKINCRKNVPVAKSAKTNSRKKVGLQYTVNLEIFMSLYGL